MKFHLRSIVFILLSLLVGAFSCFREEPYTYSFPVGETPVNLDFLNTPYDDYNSALPYAGMRSDFMFSTNRYSKVFNIIHEKLDLSYHKEDDLFDIIYVPNDWHTGEPRNLTEVNTSFDELGPYTYHDDANEYFFYASNSSGDFDIKFFYTSFYYPLFDDSTKGPINATILNTEFDDYYPSINSQSNELYFCSNRAGGVYNIYSYNLPDSKNIASSLLFQESGSPFINQNLSSNADDKCPFYFDDYLVFTSNRAGGYGGFDLWYSKYDGTSWSAPKNCGEIINSEADEYRPIMVDLSRKLMIFSSNRSAGKGGFDLYAVRVDF